MERYAETDHQYHLQQGAEVFGTDGNKMGKVKSWDDHFLVVEKGKIFSTDYYVPFAAVASYTEQEVFLNVTKDEALNKGWENEPVAGETFLDSAEADEKFNSGAFGKNAFEVEPKLPPRMTS